MKFLDFQRLLIGPPAELAIFSTYQFDPDYFERRVLTSPSVQKARRIIVYMDERQWLSLLSQDYPARLVNRRYLLVPVRRPKGVFHPKLSLLITAQSARILCGSNNLTRAGCSSNLEILNSFDVHCDGKARSDCSLAVEAFAFFRRAAREAENLVSSLAREWLEEMAASAPWIATNEVPIGVRQVRLIHTYDGSIWGRIYDRLKGDPPRRFMVVSPFFDADVEMVHRVTKQWPKCKIELVVQQNTTALNVASLLTLRPRIALSELRSSSRRLHAKIISWQSASGTGCLAGSANFTTAAFDGGNVEVCILIENAQADLEALFDRNLKRKAIAFDDFESSTDKERELSADKDCDLGLSAAVLGVDGYFRVSYWHRLSPAPRNLHVAVRAPGEVRPRLLQGVPADARTAVVELPEAALADVNGSLLASLIAEHKSRMRESVPIWIVQEARLTYEPSGSTGSPGLASVMEKGEGLVEFIEELGYREGVTAVVECLRHLNIRFDDGGEGRIHPRPFILRVRDPFRPDTTPDWLVDVRAVPESMVEAICEFADRHERRRLRRHAERGNINGMENFLDILVTLVRLLYIYYMRGVVPRGQFLCRLYRYLRIATAGIDDSDDYSQGFLDTVYENLDRDSAYLKEVDNETHFVSHLWAILLLAQEIRSLDDESPLHRKRPGEYLPSYIAMLNETRRAMLLFAPTNKSITEVLRAYNMLTDSQIQSLVDEYRP